MPEERFLTQAEAEQLQRRALELAAKYDWDPHEAGANYLQAIGEATVRPGDAGYYGCDGHRYGPDCMEPHNKCGWHPDHCPLEVKTCQKKGS